jgi:hypothetical protein
VQELESQLIGLALEREALEKALLSEQGDGALLRKELDMQVAPPQWSTTLQCATTDVPGTAKLQGHMPWGFQVVAQVSQQHALRLEQKWHPAH